MNLPNKLTVLRICLVPVVIALMLIDFPFHWLAALLVFAAASITDLLDGKIARSRGLVTDFGKFADPLADKVLVFSVLVCLVEANLAGAVVILLLLAREFVVTAVRLSAAAGGKVVAASFWAKAKTVSQMVAIIAIFLLVQLLDLGWLPFLTEQLVKIVSELLLWVTAVFSLVSGVQYVLNNLEFIKTAK